MSAQGVKAEDRISFFSYGSGAIGEFYSGFLCPEAREVVAGMGIDAKLDARREVSVAEYETIEKMREQAIEQPCFNPDFSLPEGWYDQYYQGKKRLVLRQVKDFYRSYEWS
jgi:3-hydroxy-3-methylglutaryl CoA synthase